MSCKAIGTPTPVSSAVFNECGSQKVLNNFFIKKLFFGLFSR